MRPVAAALLLGLLVPVSGCFTCQPQLDVHHCRDATGRCDPAATPPIEWNPDLAGLFPDVARLIDEVEVGGHGHADWTEAQADAFWAFYHVDPDAPDKQVLLSVGNATAGEARLVQVRVLAC